MASVAMGARGLSCKILICIRGLSFLDWIEMLKTCGHFVYHYDLKIR